MMTICNVLYQMDLAMSYHRDRVAHHVNEEVTRTRRISVEV